MSMKIPSRENVPGFHSRDIMYRDNFNPNLTFHLPLRGFLLGDHCSQFDLPHCSKLEKEQ